ncbi:MAG: HlyD family type I secretion periplasmic adaptor subunit [Legionellales bacterium]|nr:HlyD family type I secretion periplasmic adaptor subunit [Legionellales bacterium]
MLNKRTPLALALIIIVSAFLIIFLIWAHFAIIDEVTHAEGKVIPPSELKVIQNLEGGILSSIDVRAGEEVKKGDVLLRIDDTRFSASYREQRSQYLALQAQVARLIAETKGQTEITFPTELNEYPQLIQREINLFHSRQKALNESIEVLQRSYKLAKSELDMTEPLVKQGVMSKIELLRLQRQVNEVKGQINEKIDKFKEQAHTELTKQQSALESLQETLKSEQDRVERTVMRSPVDGIVNKIYINTIGGVIRPGMDIMEIVPNEQHVIVEARVKPQDRAFITIGQPAKVKLTAYDFSIYGGVEGVVSHISADTIKDEQNKENYYEVLVKTDKNYLGTKEHPLPIRVGMVANVDILTGRKSILSYLLKPLLKAKQNALTER